MQRSSVLLPEPLRPMMATIWPRVDVEADAVEHAQRAEVLDDVLDADDGSSVLIGRHCASFPAAARPTESG